MKGEQLALAVQLPQAPTFDNFLAGPNADAVTALRELASGALVSHVLVAGAPRTGRTHLLRAASAAAADHGRAVAWRSLGAGGGVAGVGIDALPEAGGDGAPAGPETLEDLDALAVVDWLALDDIDAACGDGTRALALLRLIDARRAAGRPLLLAAAAPPARLGVALPDLGTRLSAMVLLALRPLRDVDRAALLRTFARERGLGLPDEVARWLLGHFARDAGSLLAVLAELDGAALSAQRRLTLPFVQSVLAPRGRSEH